MSADNSVELKFFVVRVIQCQLDSGRWRPVRIEDMTVPAQLATLAAVRNGALCKLPGGEFAEGVKEHRNEVDAHNHRAKLASRHPGEDFRVIIETAQPLLSAK